MSNNLITRTINITENYLHIPIKLGINCNYLQLFSNGQIHNELYMPITDDKADFYSYIDVSKFKGQNLILTIENPNGISQQSLNNIIVGSNCTKESILYPDLYKEEYRPLFHFSPKRGWNNDPNGLIYINGVYHMYFQHNPFANEHGGVCVGWGHAISKDLVHWEECGDAILPKSKFWNIASGTCAIDFNNTLGKGCDTIIAAYTGLMSSNDVVEQGDPRYGNIGQNIAYSTDGGYTFTDLPQNPVIYTSESWRDPCLRWHEPTKNWIITVYEERGGSVLSFYSSKDLIKWDLMSHLPGFYECPDLYQINVEDENGIPTGEVKWIVNPANGRYIVGEFTGTEFIPEQGFECNDYGNKIYAGQTWFNQPDKRVFQIYWLPANTYEGMPFSQQMSLVTEYKLRKINNVYRIYRFPIKEMEKLRGKEEVFDISPLKDSIFSIEADTPSEYEIIIADVVEPIHITFGQHEIGYDPSAKTLLFSATVIDDDKVIPIKISDGTPLIIRIFADRTSLEFFFNGGQFSTTYANTLSGSTFNLDRNCKCKIKRWQLYSIWN